jgi:cytoskeletal protein CcmA (bactofilin family)
MSTNDSGQSGGEKRTLIEEGTAFKGVISSKHPVVVMGTVEGDISGPAVEVTETGVVTGRLKVTSLRSSGELAGEIHADEMQLSGRIRDKTILRAKFLEVKLEPAGGGLAFGECEIEVGELPDKAAAIAAITALSRGEARAAEKAEPASVAVKRPAAGEAPGAVPEEIPAETTDSVNRGARRGSREHSVPIT